MTFYFESEWEEEAFPECEAVLRSVFEAACDYVGCPYECSVNMLLTDDAAIHSMNKEFRGIDRATDVLSFPMVDYKEPGNFDGLEEHTEEYFEPESGELLLPSTAARMRKMMRMPIMTARILNHSVLTNPFTCIQPFGA